MKQYMKKIISILTFLLLGSSISKAQQDAQYSQYIFNGIYINPAYAGYKEVLNLHSFYRTQWTGVTGAPKSFSFAADAIANNGNVGLAFQVASDVLGAQKNLMAYASYAYRLKLNDEGSSRLALGVSAGIMQLGLDGSILDPNDRESRQPFGMERALLPDARFGVFFSNDRYFAGFSADNLISSAIDVTRYAYVPQPAVHYYLTAGALVPINESIQLRPSFLIKDDKKGPTSLDLNMFMILSERFWLGGSYRTAIKLYEKNNLQDNLNARNSVVGALQLFPTRNLRIGYAYDFATGPLQGYASGTHEISVGYSFDKNKVRMVSPRQF